MKLPNRIFVLVASVCFLVACTAVSPEQEGSSVDNSGVDEVAPLAEATAPPSAPTAEVKLVEPTAMDSPTEAPTVSAETPTSEPEPEPFRSSLPILQPAPNITNDVWINTDPLTLEALRGKVVLIEFWTFG